jgi:cysteine-rich repeat protein
VESPARKQSASLLHSGASTMNRTRPSFLVMSLLLAVAGCIDLPDIEPGEPTPDAGPPDAGPPDAGPPDGGPSCGDGKIDANQGEVCDNGNTTSGDGCSADCRSDETCGNGIKDVARSEACDDGNTVTETECPYGMVNCARCNATCSGELTLTGPYCGDTTRNGSEACDDGNAVTETQCPYGTATCEGCDAICSAPLNLTGPYCGDGRRDSAEACDDGNSITETACPYGIATCTHCNSTCSGELNLTGPYCGDNIQNGTEACDDGNTTTESSCAYGTATCSACNASCTSALSLTGPYCGDGIQNGSEGCDDGNSSACGTCSSTCSQVQSARATGSITVLNASSISDGNSLSIDDGINPLVIFEFDSDGTVDDVEHVRIPLSSSNDNLAGNIASAINGPSAALDITAQRSANVVTLTHVYATSLGNRTMSSSVSSSRMTVSGMSGGAGGDCPASTGCTRNEDCLPLATCLANRTCSVGP